MYIQASSETCQEIAKVLQSQSDKPQFIRVFVAGMACSGPQFGLGLDNATENDFTEEVEGVTFVVDKNTYEAVGEIKIEWMGNGYAVRPVNAMPSNCGSCSSCG